MAVEPGVVVEFDGVTKRFGQQAPALDRVSCTVRAGEVVVLLGLSGSGKSTLLRHVDGLVAPSEGTVTTLGVDVGTARGRELRALRTRVGFVFQQFHLVASLTLLENVCTGALASLRGPRFGLITYPRSVRLRALENLDRVGLADQAFQRADTLSGGQQQRGAVARALMQQPEILLADEPVASLDPESADQVMRLIARISAEDNLTVLCSLHQVELALTWGDRVIGLRSGRVVLDTPTGGLSRDAAMAVYAKVAVPGPVLAKTG
ncbi:phosphonate ABC transporter ATP-binding protein [Nocardia puris]|uniref:Phosphonate transport system ATP-binding protein n=1 Tax=Nocardia puris TaxID=208602 RepID=A0A366DKC4_9NOCA|nr:phosphonate ABC transporter ATP-binding protein [Nocardia puris]MBF6213138.1 phosphonate ABC transporter ATP-binding protein [Nocardia puris]MBF6370067.1 phosphonate ABC transporter ATP-binding protein [Nocardia puris]MBF6462763.1 phosphonate ABC transporter ATP-binding protein [Nocardia puris]RBO90385.1 phosphonate transport system ATP-binding protein [Nocardia puris]